MVRPSVLLFAGKTGKATKNTASVGTPLLGLASPVEEEEEEEDDENNHDEAGFSASHRKKTQLANAKRASTLRPGDVRKSTVMRHSSIFQIEAEDFRRQAKSRASHRSLSNGARHSTLQSQSSTASSIYNSGRASPSSGLGGMAELEQQVLSETLAEDQQAAVEALENKMKSLQTGGLQQRMQELASAGGAGAKPRPGPPPPGGPSAAAPAEDPDLEMLKNMKMGGGASDRLNALRAAKRSASDAEEQQQTTVYTLKQLKALSRSVDATGKEMYLSDTDFMEHFGMDKASFSTKPKWKQQSLKKKIGLF
jgi:hypothetical protein